MPTHPVPGAFTVSRCLAGRMLRARPRVFSRHTLSWLAIVWLWAGAARVAFTQTPPGVLDSEQSITQLVHDVWRIEDGLPQNSVRAIEQTRDGYLWLGTEEGLCRYNGISFKVFDKRSVTAFRENQSIRALMEDSHGTLWIGTMGGGLVRYRDGEFQSVEPSSGFSGKVVGAFAEGTDGEVYIGTSDEGLYVYRDNTFNRIQLLDSGDPLFVRSLTHDRYGAVWVGTRDGLFRINHGRVTSFDTADGLPDDFVMALIGDEDGSLWVGTAAGISHYKDGRFIDFEVANQRSEHPAQTIIRDRAGRIWIGLDGGGLMRLRGDHATIFDIEDGLSHNRVLSLFEDREGSIWIGTEGGGLNRLRKGKFTTYSEQEGLSLDMTLAVYADSQGDLWVGTEGGGLNRLRNGEITTYADSDGLSSNIITSIYGGEEGELWVGTFRSGLNLLYDGRFRTFTMRDGLPGNGISALFRGPSGRLWVGTDAGLASYIDGRFTSYTVASGLTSDIIMSVLESSSGDVLVGTYDTGLNVLKADGTIQHISSDEGLGSNTVTTLYEDVEGDIWLGTYGGGLSRMRGGGVQTVSTEHGLFNDNVFQILEDDRHNLWMSCNKGIFYVNKEDLNRVLDGETEAVTSISFDRSDGLKSYELNGGFQPAGWKSGNGHLWFPSVRGVVSIDPSSLQSYATVASIVVEQVRIDGEVIAFKGPVRVGPGRHKIEFDYVGLSFVNTDDLRYRYRLDGYETLWNEVQGRRTATYTNLDPGEYTFRVMVADDASDWGAREATVTLKLLPAFYQTSWFWVLCVGALVVFAISLYLLRIRSLKKRQRELEAEVSRRTGDLKEAKDKLEEQTAALGELYRFKAQFFNNISHELRTPLTLLLGPLENALTGAYGRMNGLLRGQLEIMLRNGRRLLRLINQLLDLAKLESQKMELRARPGNLSSFVEGIVLSFSAFALERKIEIEFETDDEDALVYFDPEKLEKILFNLLSNAVKFTLANGRIDVRVGVDRTREGYIDISVGDTGPGIPADRLERIFDRYHQVDGSVSSVQEGTGIGLSLARELVELHHGTISVQSVVGSGATFTVSLPMGADHLRTWEIGEEQETDYMGETRQSMVQMVAAATDYVGAAPGVMWTSSVGEDAPLILVVVDNLDIREYVVGCLYPDYRVMQARSGEDALATIQKTVPELILTNVMMPDMDGHELVKRLKESDEWAKIPVVMLTAKASELSKIEWLEMGVDDYIAKPFNARELRARIRNLLRIHEQEKELRMLNDGLERRVREHVSRILGERRRYEQELVAARDKAEASARMKSTILDNISHELRTPLSTILGYAQVLSSELDSEQKEFAHLIVHGGRRLLSTLGSIIDLSQLESGSVELTPSEFSVSAVAAEVVQTYQEQADEKGITLQTEFPVNDPIVYLDRVKTRRILDHMLNNAVKFTDSGSVTVRLVQRGDILSIAVEDTGPGISKEYLPRLFMPFTQESSGTDRSHEGSGFGLAVARGLAELMFGRIDVSSRLGNGSTFTVTLPVRLPERPAPAADREPQASRQESGQHADAKKPGPASTEQG